MFNIRSINIACNDLNLFDVIKYIGSLSSLAQLDTLIIDRNSFFDRINMYNTYEIGFKIFCNQSFSTKLRRLSMQQTGAPIFNTIITKCLPNLRSLSFGHDTFLQLLHNGHYVTSDMSHIMFQALSSLFYLKVSAIQTSGPTKVCFADDIDFDDYFIDENQFQNQIPLCKSDDTDNYIQMHSCLRAFQLNFYAEGMTDIEAFYQEDFYIPQNNSLELLDLSYSLKSIKGVIYKSVSFSGFHRLRILKFRHMNIIFFYMVTFNYAENLQDIDLSDNRLEQMTAEQLSNMFTKSIYIRKLNLSSCSIVTLNSNFLRQFPLLTYLDLSYNKISRMSLNLSWLRSHDNFTFDLSFNQISVINNSFIESVQHVKQLRNITLKMNDNQFRCDCDTLGFLRWFQNTNINIENKANILCNYLDIDNVAANSVNVNNLEFQCTKYVRILYISISIVFGTITVGIVSGIMLFKYRWHIRWYWYRAKRKIQKKKEYANLQFPNESFFLCYVNYLGVSGDWIMQEIVTPIENMNIGDVFIFERNTVAGMYVLDAIMDGINNSRKLLYIVGNEQDVGERQWFFFSLQLATVERLKDVIVVYKEVDALQNLQQKIPLLKSGSINSITYVQYETNDMFWPEMLHKLNSNCSWQGDVD